MRVLLVEDDEDLSGRIAAVLRSENFVVDIARNGEDALHAGLTELFDVAILDLGLPKIDGVSVLKGWREGDRNLPVLVLTARDGWPDKVSSFKAGADDFLAKPFKVEELVLRLRALVRRASGHAASRLVCGALVFDAQLGTFELDGLPLKLTALEWRVLSCLMLRKEMIVDRRELTERVYDGDAEVDSNSIEVIIARLRKKLGADRIETVRGRGYMLTAAVAP
ncbi:response regulator transcription factor [Rhizobium leguminosarum]|jgi:DNA-binding response OmpR family regulator|uniref:Transcriptional regulator n=1 Tax=Rhizobium leguminosarum bv. trifolii TaxID=386 RepID=A0A1B8R6Z2_RHILT|nr:MULTISPECIES: response regulator transcription factor [Rhizobium]AOO92783.1 transcriptional regulator [Rhizobium leguminosarum bv. trifolii]MBA8833971.1 DNA-binding response OmpR family regulator [Rhizobium leguminosarum]MBY5462208.1 response regulator transcription factor [Rhizobium leguminosarum]MBY5915112.1 response regulator transcription factor [Rhizobium leguminosarum]MDH6273790.1 two-component system OmpR family response regulator [Rhizobium leguminosarum]